MSYTALYRKFRPQDFEDVKGQDHIVTALRNQIETKRVSHAYLFTGTRGTGKTTMARILARAVNCEHPVTANSARPARRFSKIMTLMSSNWMQQVTMVSRTSDRSRSR